MQVLAPPRTGKTSEAAATSAAAAPQPWYKLPETKITDEVKTELRLLRLRGAYDPKRFYKVRVCVCLLPVVRTASRNTSAALAQCWAFLITRVMLCCA